ncbi:MAG: bifunctional folylpolyglutamate synthase/dihydrofolate synthase [Desulfobulbaceae bacterium]|jgi:dihydrofolate synthase/folylpolyglutamate synthase|nr:bifunctional folylpolyglutamate synthase/dihydrofolate synthase [Desulfobulbaceae bacterium]
MNYKETWQYLDDLQFHKIKLGLDSMNSFLAKVGNPQLGLSCVHVGGTNGKGSVSMNILTILAGAGYRVGLFTSPHLSSVRERFRIGHDYISEEKFAEIGSRIRRVLGGDPITYFEFTTALAMLWFAEEKVDMAIFEVGLGGRLDATNVITPLVSVITNVSMDHEAYLGDTLRQVAGEKAGIIKDQIPLVTGVASDDSLQVVETKCQELNVPMYLLGRDFSCPSTGEGQWQYRGTSRTIDQLQCGMRGAYQQGNSGLALAAIELLAPHGFQVSDQVVGRYLKKVHWPGRLESIDVQQKEGEKLHYLLDGAHNPAGMESLLASLDEYDFKRLICIWGAMADKDIGTTLNTIAGRCDVLILTKPDSERAASPVALQAHLDPEFQGEVILVDTVERALAQVQARADADDLILVAGSLYLVGASRVHLVGELVP